MQNQAIDILKTLIAFETVSRDSNLKLIDWFEDYCVSYGARAKRIYNQDNNKANLIIAFGPDIDGGIVLSGHSDVVPIDDQEWNTNPFELTQIGDKLYGRGTSDMKAFSACFLAMVPRIAHENLKRPIYFALSYDEEVGCLGAPSMVDELANNFPKIDAVIVGEPTNMKVVSAHKSISTFKIEITGHEAHSSRPDQGVSAIMEAIDLLAFIKELSNSVKNPNSIFEPDGATLSVGIIEGGTAVNILAHHCRFLFDIRCEPDFDNSILIDKIAQKVAQTDIAIKKRAPNGGAIMTRRSNTPGLKFEANSNSENICRQITGDNDVFGVAYAAEAGLFQRAGLNAVICGPGSILQAHQPDEFIEVNEIAKCISFLEKLIDNHFL